MSGAMWAALATVVGATIVGIATYMSRRQTQLLSDCRSAIRDLKRLRQLEDEWAKELARLNAGTSPEAERKRIRGMLKDRIGQYGEPARIDKLLERLG